MKTNNLIIISNRLPFSVSKVEGKLIFTPSDGGLATAMMAVAASDKMLWIGWPGISSDELTSDDKKVITKKLLKHGCFPVYLTKTQVDNFYFGYSNETIWPLFHYFPQYAHYNRSNWMDYKDVNKLYRDAVLKQADGDNVRIWIHDYHLLLLPELLRKKLPNSSIGFFLHIPFPSFEIFRLLPNGRELLKGLLGADLVGFHTYDYTRHFLSSVVRMLGYENSLGTISLKERTVRTDAFPISIDYDKFAKAVKTRGVQDELNDVRATFAGQRVILSLDRVDYSKGILKRLTAYDLFLKQNPQHHGKIIMVMIAIPSRTEVEAYMTLRKRIEQTVGRINGKYSSLNWTPINYHYRSIPFDRLVALYNHADIALITPLRDGMNLVAKEYIAAKHREKGVLILSEMAGAASELPESLLVNPNDTQDVSNAITSALKMSVVEQRRRMSAMQLRLQKYTVDIWAKDFMEQLALTKKRQELRAQQSINKDDRDNVIKSAKSAKKRLFLLDYDGTLVNFVSSPGAVKARPPMTLLKLIKKLADVGGNKVMIVSGRPKKVLEAWFGHLPIALIAEHGGWIKDEHGWSQYISLDKSWKSDIMTLLKVYEERTPGAIVEEKDFAVVWHYRNVTHELAFARNTELKHDVNELIRNSDVGMFEGKKIIEIKPLNMNKGAAIEHILADYKPEFIFAAGDDYTDEDMFEALPPHAFSFKVGLVDSKARFRLQTPEDVVNLLKDLAGK